MGNIMTGIPLIGGAFDNTDDLAMEQLLKNQGLYSNLDTPKFDLSMPENYQVAGELKPEDALYQTISEDPRLKSAQMSALDRLSGYAENGLSDVDNAGYAKARNQAAQIMRSGNQAALQNAQARGVGGSGLEFAMREMANQQGAQAAQEAGLQQAADSARQRALYETAYGDRLAQVRGQDESINKANTDIINQFNQANTQARNNAQQFNLQNKQNINNQNVEGRNSAQQYRNQMAQQGFNNQVTKVGGQAQANTGMAQGYAAQNAANTSERNANTQLLTGGLMPAKKGV